MLQTLNVSPQTDLAPREAALAKLRRIEAIRVDHKVRPPGGGASLYVIDLYLRVNAPAPIMPRSQLALHDITASAEGVMLSREHVAGRDPTKSVGKAYLEVFELKDKLEMAALGCRSAKRCRVCQSMFEFCAGLTKTPAAVVRAMSTTATKRREIETMMNALVGIVVRAQILTSSASQCESDEKIPIMIQEFLSL